MRSKESATTSVLPRGTANLAAIIGLLEVGRAGIGLARQIETYRTQGLDFLPGAAGWAFGAAFVVRGVAAVALLIGAIVVLRKRSPRLLAAGAVVELAGILLIFAGEVDLAFSFGDGLTGHDVLVLGWQLAVAGVLPVVILLLVRRREAPTTQADRGTTVARQPAPARASTGPSTASPAPIVKTDLGTLVALCRAYAANDEAAIGRLEPEATRIGKELDRRGGIAEMRKVFAQIPDMRGKRTLEMHWGGIGEWRG